MNDNQVISLLTFTLIGMVFILSILVCVYIWLRMKTKRDEQAAKGIIKTNKKQQVEEKKEYNKQSIFKFMEFDSIRDNMIVQKDGKRFLMVIECQGINFDLMSGLEKNSVEQGFLQFLNTLRNPIQIYVQTRTVNLAGSINSYKDRVNNIAKQYRDKQIEYKNKVNSGKYTQEQLNREKYELTRQKNLYEYSVDIVNNTERLSLNKNILSKHYYIIVPQYVEDNPDAHYAKDEIANITFADLYTKAQTIINSLGVCGVTGKILDTVELAELLYVAYNRDESEMFSLRKALNAGFEDIYTTAPDVYEKRIKELDKKITESARIKANKIAYEAIEETEKQRIAKQKESELDFLINQMVKAMIKENEKSLGKEVTDKAIELVDEESNKQNGGEKDEEKQKKTKRTKSVK